MENNNLTSKVHTLKIDQQPFLDICSGAKTCEIRRDDRGFKVGDTVRLFEHVDGSPTDRQVARTISHIQRDYGLPAGMCILSYGVLKTATQVMQEQQALELRAITDTRRGKSWFMDRNREEPVRIQGLTFDHAILDEMVYQHPTQEAAIAAAVRDAISTGHGSYAAECTDGSIKIEHLSPLSAKSLYDDAKRTMTQAEFRTMYDGTTETCTEQSTGYTAVDMATAAAQGFRDGQASVVVDMSDLSQCFSPHDCGDWAMWRDDVKRLIGAAGGKVKE